MFYKFDTLSIQSIHTSLFFIIFNVKIKWVTFSYLIHFTAAGFTLLLGVEGVYIRT